MPAHPRVRIRHEGPLLAVEDVECGRCDARPGRSEVLERPEIVFIRRGLFVREAGRESVTADANRIVFFNAGESYRITHPAGGGDACTALRFRGDLLTEAFGDPGNGAMERIRSDGEAARAGTRGGGRALHPFGRSHAPAATGLILRLQRLRGALGRPRRDDLEIDGLAMSILAAAAGAAGSEDTDAGMAIGAAQGSHRWTEASSVDGAPRRSDGAGDVRRRIGPLPRGPAARRALRDRVEACRWILGARLGEPLGLGDLGREVGVSPFHLHRAFRAVTGMPVHRYRIHLRLRAALDRIAGGESDLSRMAIELGWSSHAHFTTAFRRAFGTAPSSLRSELTGRRALPVRS